MPLKYLLLLCQDYKFNSGANTKKSDNLRLRIAGARTNTMGEYWKIEWQGINYWEKLRRMRNYHKRGEGHSKK